MMHLAEKHFSGNPQKISHKLSHSTRKVFTHGRLFHGAVTATVTFFAATAAAVTATATASAVAIFAH